MPGVALAVANKAAKAEILKAKRNACLVDEFMMDRFMVQSFRVRCPANESILAGFVKLFPA